MTSGFDIGVAAKALAPLLQGLAKAAVSQVQESIAKWKASDFPERLASKLAIADRVKTIWSRDHFVSLTECYHPSSIDRDNNRVPINAISGLPKKNIVIEGIVGQGKSMFLHYLYLQEISGHGSGGLPLLILLRTITEKRGFHDHLKDALTNLEIDPSDAVIDYLAKSGHLILLLDGFDELDVSLVSETIGAIESMIFKYPTVRIIVTSRPNSDIQKSRYFDVLQLSELEPSEYDQFLKKLGIDAIRRNEIITAIEESPADVAQLISTPLMLTLVAHVYAAEKEIPSELPLFFERLFVTTFVGHDRQKGGGFRRQHHTGLSERKVQLLFEAFCFLTLQREIGRTLSGEQFADIFDAAERLVDDAACSVDKFKLDITKVACLMLEDGFDQTSFLHMSIAEYFAAAYVKRSNENFAMRFYSYAIEKHRALKIVLSFLEKIDSYRFNKFYVIPALRAFFSALSSSSKQAASKEAWFEFMRKTFPKLEVGFDSDGVSTPVYLRVIKYGPNTSAKFGPMVYEFIRNALFKAIQRGAISESGFLECERFFRHGNGDPDEAKYLTGLEGLLRIFGQDVFYEEFQRLEQSLWIRFSQAKAVIENEDSKTDLVLWQGG